MLISLTYCMYVVFMMPCTTRIVSCVPVSTVILMLSWDAAYRIVMLISLTYVVPDTYTTHTLTYMRSKNVSIIFHG